MTMSGVGVQAKATEEVIHSAIERMIFAVTAMPRDREVALISDVEAVKYQKEKELQFQKDELEFLLNGIRHAVLFSDAMMKEGSETEIVASHQQVVARMTTLTKEREKVQLDPITDAEIEFVGGKEGQDLLSSVIQGLGTVVDTSISTEHSIIEKSPMISHMVNQPYSFKIMLVDKAGNKATAETMNKGLAFEVIDPSKAKVCVSSSLPTTFRSMA